MNAHDESEIKREFQLERVILFSDAVFAIIITIMILDVKLPEVTGDVNSAESKNLFLQVLPKLLLYTVSFFVIGSFWMRHLRMFSFLRDYNALLIVLNLIFLFSISLFPFALSFGFTRIHVMHYFWGYYIYLGIIFFAFFTQTLLIGYLVRYKNELCVKKSNLDAEFKWKSRRISLFTLPITMAFLYIVLQYHWDLDWSFAPLIVSGIISRIINRKYYPDQTPIKRFKKF